MEEATNDGGRCLNAKQIVSRYGVLAGLHTDILTGNIQSVKQKLENGTVDVNCSFRFTLSGKNTFHSLGSRLVRERLLSITSTPLHTACISRRLPLVKLLLDHGAQPNQTDSQQRVAALLVLQYWPRIKEKSCQVGMTKEEKRYQLHIKKQHKIAAATLILLIERGAIITSTINNKEECLVHIAARYNLVQAMEILVKFNAPLDAPDYQGTTPLLLAAEVGNFQIVQLLLRYGADVHRTDHGGMSVLHFLALADRTSTCRHMQHFLQRSRELHATNAEGQTALHLACKHANEAAIHALIRNGLDPDALDGAGKSPLFELLDGVACLDAVYGLELLLQWTIHPKVQAKDGSLPSWITHASMHGLRDKLLPLSDVPPTLQRICKVHIRRAMGMERLNPHDIKRLPCAIGLTNIILYNTAEWWQ